MWQKSFVSWILGRRNYYTYAHARMFLCSYLVYTCVLMFLCSYPYVSMIGTFSTLMSLCFYARKFWIQKILKNIFTMDLKFCIKNLLLHVVCLDVCDCNHIFVSMTALTDFYAFLIMRCVIYWWGSSARWLPQLHASIIVLTSCKLAS